MNSESMPKELDVFISILGEIDMIKNQIGMLDKNTHISLSHSNVSSLLGNSECFKILKLVETLNADVSNLNASLLNAAHLVAAQYNGEDLEEKKTSNSSSKGEVEEAESGKEDKKENETINNMLQYFKERFESNGGE